MAKEKIKGVPSAATLARQRMVPREEGVRDQHRSTKAGDFETTNEELMTLLTKMVPDTAKKAAIYNRVQAEATRRFGLDPDGYWKENPIPPPYVEGDLTSSDRSLKAPKEDPVVSADPSKPLNLIPGFKAQNPVAESPVPEAEELAPEFETQDLVAESQAPLPPPAPDPLNELMASMQEVIPDVDLAEIPAAVAELVSPVIAPPPVMGGGPGSPTVSLVNPGEAASQLMRQSSWQQLLKQPAPQIPPPPVRLVPVRPVTEPPEPVMGGGPDSPTVRLQPAKKGNYDRLSLQPTAPGPVPIKGFWGNIADSWMLHTLWGQAISQGVSFRPNLKSVSDGMNYNPFTDPDVDFTGFEGHLAEFTGAADQQEVAEIKSSIRNNLIRRENLTANRAGTSIFIGGAADPINLIPIPMGWGLGLVRGARKAAITGGAYVAAYEAGLKIQDPTKNWGEVVASTAAGVLLFSAIGSVGGTLGKMPTREIARRAEAMVKIIDGEGPEIPPVQAILDIQNDTTSSKILERLKKLPPGKIRDAAVKKFEAEIGRGRSSFAMETTYYDADGKTTVKVAAGEEKSSTAALAGGTPAVDPLGTPAVDPFDDVARQQLLLNELAVERDPEVLRAVLQEMQKVGPPVKEVDAALKAFDDATPTTPIENALVALSGARNSDDLLKLGNDAASAFFIAREGNAGVAAKRARAKEAAILENSKEGDSRIMPGAFLDKILKNWHQMPWYVLKGNAFTGKLGTEIARIADRIAWAPVRTIESEARAVSAEAGSMLLKNRRANALREAQGDYVEYVTGSRPKEGTYTDVTVKLAELRDSAKNLAGSVRDRLPGEKKPPADDPISSEQFRELVGRALANGDKATKDAPPEVAEFVTRAAKNWRKEFFEPYEVLMRELDMNNNAVEIARLERAITRRTSRIAEFEGYKTETPMWPKRLDAINKKIESMTNEVANKRAQLDVLIPLRDSPIGRVGGDESFFHRIWDLEAVDRNGEELAGILDLHFKKTELKTNNSDLDEAALAELRAVRVATAMTNIRKEAQLLGTSDEATFLPGPAKARKIDIPNHLVEDFIHLDVDMVTRAYENKMGGAIELTRIFGDPLMRESLDQLEDRMSRVIYAAKTERDRATLQLESDRMMRAIVDLRDLQLGIYGIPNDPSALSLRLMDAGVSYALLTQYGKAWQAQVADIGVAMFTHGFKPVVGRLFSRFGNNMDAIRLAEKEADEALALFEVLNQGRFQAMVGLTETIPYTKVERFIGKQKSWMNILNVVGPWTDFWERAVGGLAASAIIKRSIALADGTATKADTEWLKSLSIGVDEAVGIVGQWKLAGSQIAGKRKGQLHIANATKWEDETLTRLYRLAINAEVRQAVIRPGVADRPKFMTKSMWRFMLLYKGFTIAATQRIAMTALQQKDKRIASGLLTMVAIGYMVDYLRSTAFDKRGMLDPDRFVRAVDLSGITGVVSDLNSVVEMASGNSVGFRPLMGMKPHFEDATWAQRWGAILGAPSTPFLNMAYALISSDASGSQVARSVRRMVPFNNVIFWDGLITRLTRGLGEQLDERLE